MTDHSLYQDKQGKVLDKVRQIYDPLRPTTWPYFIIEMPLDRDGNGPAEIGKDAYTLDVQVWDRICGCHGSFGSISQALTEALRLNKELLG